MKKVGSVLFNIFIWTMVVVVTIFIFFTLQTKKDDLGPTVFGKSFRNVVSDSMNAPEPAILKEKPELAEAFKNKPGGFKKNDLIILKILSDEEKSKLEIGDIVTFKDTVDTTDFKKEYIVNTHRIIDIIKRENEKPFYVTQGDNETSPDRSEKIPEEILAKYEGTKIAGAGGIIVFLQTDMGFFCCLILPLAIFFIWRVWKLIRAIRDYNKAARLEQEEAKKRAAIETAKAEIQAEREAAIQSAQQDFADINQNIPPLPQTPAPPTLPQTQTNTTPPELSIINSQSSIPQPLPLSTQPTPPKEYTLPPLPTQPTSSQDYTLPPLPVQPTQPLTQTTEPTTYENELSAINSQSSIQDPPAPTTNTKTAAEELEEILKKYNIPTDNKNP